MEKRIIIEDEDKIKRRNIEEIVMRMGYRKIIEDGGVSEMGLIRKRKDIVMVMMEIKMKDMEGIKVL